MILLKNTNINRSTSFLEASTFTKLLLRFHNYIFYLLSNNYPW